MDTTYRFLSSRLTLIVLLLLSWIIFDCSSSQPPTYIDRHRRINIGEHIQIIDLMPDDFGTSIKLKASNDIDKRQTLIINCLFTFINKAEDNISLIQNYEPYQWRYVELQSYRRSRWSSKVTCEVRSLNGIKN